MGTSLMAGHNWNRPICHAWAKSMKRPCVRKVGLRRNGSLHVVCPSHGSKTPPYSERPISAAGKARIGAAARDMWARYRQLKAAGLPTWQVGRPKKPAATPRALAPRATNPAYLLAIIWSRIPSPEGLSFESLLCVEISWYSPHHPLRRQQT
jgi:hypothetical protein